MKHNYARYSEQTKKEALELSDKIGVKAASEKLNLSYKTISYWRGQRKKEIEYKTSKIIKPVDYNEELKQNPKITFQADELDRQFKRGDIYYVTLKPTIGSEITSGRPAIVVSNNFINQNFSSVEVVYLTTKPKPTSPEHVTIKSSGTVSTAICEQITTVDRHRLREYIGQCTPLEMKLIDKAMLSSLGLIEYTKPTMSDDQIVARMNSIVAERNAYKELYDNLFDKILKGKVVVK